MESLPLKAQVKQEEVVKEPGMSRGRRGGSAGGEPGKKTAYREKEGEGFKKEGLINSAHFQRSNHLRAERYTVSSEN